MLSLLPPRIEKTAREISRRVQVASERFIAVSRPSVMPEALAFLDPIDEIEEEVPPKFLRSALYVVLAMFVIMVLAAALVRYDVHVSGTGRIATEVPPVVMQSFDRSVIRDLPVRVGDVVKKGQVLATLDPTFAQADLSALTGQQQAHHAHLMRLEAEMNGEALKLSAPPTPEEQLQKSLYEQRQLQYASRLRIFDEELQRRRANARTAEDNRVSLAKQLENAKEVESMRAQGVKNEFGSKLNLLEAQSSRMRIEQNMTDTANRLDEIKHDLQSKEAERQAFIDEWRQQILDNLITVRAELGRMSEGIAKAALVKDLQVITSPQDAVVLDVIRRGVGSIVQGGEPVVTLVESHSTLVADITINSGSIGYTRTGDSVVVKVDAFPYQRHGFLKGRLASIGQESFPVSGGALNSVLPPAGRSQQSGAFHQGRVELLDTKLEEMPDGALLTPGMTLTAEIKVGTRSVLSYFLNPLTRVFGESIREP